ncbi:MAG: glutamate synthase-related protein, partial [Acidimicrobiia bacterium]
MLWVVIVAVIVLVGVVAAYDLVQRKHAILRNFPGVGHLRYLLEGIGPELRQYIVTDNDSDRPFSRDQRRWVYTSAKRVNSYIGYGTDNDLERTPGYVIVRPQAFPLNDPVPDGAPLPCAKVLGAARKRARAFRMGSAVNISSMSYGSLGARAVEALNGGAALAGCLQGTGEGGLTPYHQRGGELV